MKRQKITWDEYEKKIAFRFANEIYIHNDTSILALQ